MDPCHGYLRIVALTLTLGILAGCASERVLQPAMPDESMLAPAEAALNEARDAGAEESAPELLHQAERRLVKARGILFRAAAASREPSRTERLHVQRLVDEIRLDARLAVVRTRRAKVETRLAEVQARMAALDAEDNP